MHSILRVFKFAFQKLFRNGWLSLVTITVLMLALLSINSLIVFNYIAEQSIGRVEEKVDISIYFKQGVQDVEIQNVERFLSGLDIVQNVTYVSPQQALDAFKQRHTNSDDILGSLDELDENPLPASLIVQAQGIEEYEKILDILSNDAYQKIIGNTSFEDYRTLITKLDSIVYNVKYAGYIISGFFVLMAILVIINTVRINVYTYREEIRIMKLVGATNTFVRAPFILESIFLGIIALIVIAIMLYPILNIIQPYLGIFFGGEFNVITYFQNNFFMIFGAELVAVACINVLASGFAVGRYLKV